MKKNYFMLVCLVLLSAFSAKAQVTTVADLFGNYKFTATVAFESEEYKNSYGSVLVNESDVTIQKGGDRDGVITGFIGSENPMYFDFSDNTISISNPNYNLLWNNSLMLADADANNPYGVFGTDDWTVKPLELNYTFNPETKEITVPDFTIIHMYQYKDATANKMVHVVTHIATYTNVKMTYVGAVEPDAPAFDWTGTWTFNGTPGEGSAELPPTFEVVVEFVEADVESGQEAKYVVTNFMGTDIVEINYGGIVLTIAGDGRSATLANGNVQSLGGGSFLKLFDGNGTANPIAITLNDDGTLSMADFSIVSGAWGDNENNTFVGWYQNVSLTKGGAGVDTSAFNWVGQHTVKAGEVEALDGNAYPNEFTLTIAEVSGKYFVTEAFGTDVVEANYGVSIPFTIATDGMSAEMAAGYCVGGSNPVFLYMCDKEGEYESVNIKFVVNNDGSVSIDDFSLLGTNFDTYESAIVALYKNVTIPAADGEVVEPEEPETPAFDWTGTYTFNATLGEGSTELPTTFEVVVEFLEADEYNPAMYGVTSFMGNDVVAINYGPIELTIAEDGKSATLANGNVQSLGGGSFLKLFDVNASANPIAITLNDDGTLSMADFSIVSGAWGNNENNTFVGWYQNVTLTKGGETEKPEEAAKQYRVKSDNGYLNVYSTLAYPTGPMGGVNAAAYAEDDNQIFTMEDAGNGAVYLKSASGYYIYCQSWNVDGNATEKSALTFEDAGNDKFYIKCAKGYFKVEYVSNTPVATVDGAQVEQPAVSGYFPYCDAAIGAAALWTLEEVADETGIEDVVVEAVVEGIYDMQGRRIDAVVAPGLYIINGKKVLVK